MPPGRATPVSNGARRQSMLPTVAGDGASSVKVVVRIRPNSGADASAVPQRFQRTVVHSLDSTALEAENAGPSTASTIAATPGAGGTGKYGKSAFTFDRVVSPEEGQPQVYECAEPLVASFLDGMNATILAYGQTGSGKSYTMGTDRLGSAGEVDEERQGITPRAVAEIFERLNEAQRSSKGAMSFTAKVSYIEIYNEDLIDLLGGDAGVRPTVQIREDKSGHIVWQGLREVKVSSAAEVMNLLAEGSTLRQTGSTEMNSQSSRSHAIFSLTVTQRKWAGPGSPPSSSSSPQPPSTPRAGSRLSMLPRSPAAGRSTPTLDRPASRSGLRPPSQLGRPMSPNPHEDGGAGAANAVESWTNLTSKFHFVDLAGSERLKRTAAVGARAKEGIQINAGLSALGNVISALGDPSKKATHIPYRDSKLTRLLQDSLGGNSFTMMIACVSPTEFNLHETLSTLKYANRARNIKNRAEINEVEAGWDDIDYLHRTITKLRADLAAIRSGDAPAMSAIAEESVRRSMDGGPTSTEVELQQKVAQLTADLVKAESTATSSLSRDQFTAAVEPIVEEYERSLSALESQLALTRAALGHSEDEMHELETRVEEEVKANEANAHLIDDLRLRVAKLSERESTTEAYVRDLESKLKDVDDAGDAHGVAVADLRKELARNREQAETTELYVKDVEARLAKADEANAALRRQVEVLEREIERREEAHRELEARVSLLDTTSESKLLLAEIDEKDRRLLDLERALDDLKTRADSAEGEAQQLQRLADEEKAAKEELVSQVRTLERAAIVRRSVPDTPPQTPGDSGSPDASIVEEDAKDDEEQAKDKEAVLALQARVDQLQAAHEETLTELEMAKGKYQESLKEIADLNAQVQETKLLRSQRSLSDMSDVASPASATFPNGRSGQRSDEQEEEDDEVEELASISSRNGGSRSNSPNLSRSIPRTPHARRSMPLSPQHSRLSFLGARGTGAASPSQHLRSASLSQEFSLAAFSQMSSPPSPRPVSPSPSSRERPSSLYGASAPLSMPPATSPGERSYEQVKEEVLKLQTALNEREMEISTLESTIHQLRTPTISSTTPADSPVVSLHVERSSTPPPPPSDTDLSLSPRTLAAFNSIKADLNGTGLGLVNAIPPDDAVSSSPTSPSDETANHGARLDDLMRSMAQKESTHREAIDDLEGQLATLQRQHDELTVLSRDQVVNMSTEIERLRVALEERPEKGVMDEKLQKLEDVLAEKEQELQQERMRAEQSLEKAKRELVEEHEGLLQSTIASHDSTLDRLRSEHSAALEQAQLDRHEALKQRDGEHQSALAALVAKHDEDLLAKSGDRESALQDQAREIESRLQTAGEEHSAAVDALRKEHSAALEEREASHSDALAALKEGHSVELERAAEELSSRHAAELDSLRQAHATALDEKEAAYSAELVAVKEGHAADLKRVTSELSSRHASDLDSLRQEHSAALTEKEAAHSAVLEEKERAHSAEVASLRDGQSADVEKATRELSSGHVAELEALRSSHVDALTALRGEHEGAVSTLEEEHRAELERAVAAKEEELRVSLAEEQEAALARLRDEHSAAVDEKEEQYQAALDSLRSTLVAEHSSATETLRSHHSSAVDTLRSEHFATLTEKEATHSAALEEMQRAHSAEVALLRDGQSADVEKATSELSSRHAAELDALRSSHEDALTALQGEHDQALAALEEQHRAELERAVAAKEEELRVSLAEEQEAALARLRDEHSAAVEEMEQQHRAALDSLRSALLDEHSSATETLRSQHSSAVDTLRAEHSAALESVRTQHVDELNRLRSEHSALSDKQQQDHAAALASVSTIPHDSLRSIEVERDEARSAHNTLAAELDALRDDLQTTKVALAASSAQYDEASQRASTFASRFEAATAEIAQLKQSLKQHEQASTSTSANGELQEALDALGTLEKALRESQDERERLLVEVSDLKGGEAKGRTKYDSMFKDLEQYRQSVTKLDLELVKTRKERDSLSAQLARQSLSSSSNSHGNHGLGISSPTGDAPLSHFDRATSPPLRSERFLSNGSTYSASFANGKPPPPTPPPSIPPPPAPLPNAPLPPVPQGASPLRTARSSSLSSTSTIHGRSSISGETPATSVRSHGSFSGPSSSSTTDSSSSSSSPDRRILERFKDQEAQIARLTKQLAQKEADLQAQVDLGNTLDQALNDSERNLRKARLQSNEYARERDQFKADAERLRLEAQDSHSTSESYRQSVLDLETRLQHERDVQLRNERARQDMESRMNEMNRRPKSKFACF